MKEMQAIILAAGIGRRLGNLTDGLPKCYLSLNGERIFERHLRLLRSRNIKDIIVVTGYKKEKVESDFRAAGIEFVFNPFYATTNVLTSFWFGARFLRGEFIFLHADTVFEERILDDLLEREGDALLSVDFHPCGEEEMKVKTKGNIIVDINKTMSPQEADGEFIGLARFSTSTLKLLQREAEHCLVENHFDKFFEFALQRLIQQGLVEARASSVMNSHWCEIDFPEDYKRAVKYFST